MSLQFQGIVRLTGFKDAVEKAASKYEKGVYVTSSDTQNGFTTTIILNQEDAVSFWANQGVDAKLKQKFSWFHPIRSFRAQIKELKELQGKFNPFFSRIKDFKARVQAYVDKHPEVDATGKPVIIKKLIPMKA
ncbi:MAG: hypothetical protein K2X66_05875 [Cyanobacteria bacterium]|nr:hypothetical protein [Cyanobacteriota bacterium]